MRPDRRSFLLGTGGLAALFGVPRIITDRPFDEIKDEVPTGTVVRVEEGTPCPPGWLPCDGRLHPTRRKPKLARVLQAGMQSLFGESFRFGSRFATPRLDGNQFGPVEDPTETVTLYFFIKT